MSMSFRNPLVAGEELTITGLRSSDYAEGTQGWRISRDGSSQFTNISAIGDFGSSGDINADSFHVGPGGLWLPDQPDTDVMTRLQTVETGMNFPPIVTFYSDNGAYAPAAAVEVGIAEIQWNDPIGGFLCVVAQAGFTSSVAGDTVGLKLRYTSNGTTPTVSSTTLQAGPPAGIDVASRAYGGLLFYAAYFSPDTPHRLLLTVARTAGTGNVNPLYTGNVRQEVVAFRINPSAVASSWVQPSTASAPARVPVTRTKNYWPVWSRTYDGDNSTTFDDSDSCYQGYYSSNRGNTKSLVGYDYAAIQSDLTGATVNSTKLTFKVKHAYYGAGVDVVVGGHTYTSKPATWSGGSVAEDQYRRNNSVQGSQYTATLPASFGANLKSGTWRGIAFGPGPSNARDYYGYLYGATEAGKPYLTITYTK